MNKVVHFEIPFDDAERAQTFYKELFGWNINKAGDMPYWIVHSGPVDEQQMPMESGFINGGMLQRDESNDPSGSKPVLVVKVESIEEHCKNAETMGAKVVLPARKVGDMGIYARIQDTEGNVIGLWQDLKK
jgi:uncharacterized protein